MKKANLILFFTIGFLIIGNAQNAIIWGKIRNEKTNELLPSANVVIEELQKGCVSDNNGRYELTNLMEGEILLKITYVGFKEVIKKVSLVADQKFKIDIYLTPEILQVESFVVTGSKVEISRRNVPLSVSVISEKEIERSAETNILPLLSENVPGLFVTQRGVTGFGVAGGAAGKISIRGIGGSPNTQVLLLIDGHPQYMGIFGHPLPDAYVSSDVSKIEVIRGPASILYGSNAMGGVINIITKKQKTNGFSTKLKAMGGSFNTWKYTASAGFKKNKFSVYSAFNHDQTDGHRENSEFDIYNGFVKANYELSKNVNISIDANLAKFKSNDPGPVGISDSSYIIQKHWVDIKRGKISLSVDNKYEVAEGALKLFYNFGEHNIYDGFHSNDINAGITFYQGLKLFRNNIITLGADYENYGGKAENIFAMSGEGVVFCDTSLNEMGVYVLVQQNISQKLILTTGLRLDNNMIFGNEIVPQVGLSWLASKKYTLKTSVAKGYRNPTIKELFLWNAANPNLKPENMWNYEIGLFNVFSKKLKCELTLFYSKGENLIMMTGQYPNLINENVGNFKNFGIEFSASYQLNKNFKFSTNYSYLHTDKPIISMPEHQLFVKANYSHKKLSVNLSVLNISNLYTNIVTLESQSYTILNSRISYKLFDYLNVFVSGQNLLNQEYEINYHYPMPGISVFGGVSFNLNFKN